MSAGVPMRRSSIREADVRNGVAVSSRTHTAAAEILNWCGGNGECLVPGYDPDVEILAGGTATFRFYVAPTGRAVRRTWHVYALGSSASGSITVTPGSAAAVALDVSYSSAGAVPFTVNEDLAAKSSAAQEIQIKIDNAASSGTVRISGLDCYEAPRAVLDMGTSDYGIDVVTEGVRETISSRAYSSLGGIAAALALATQRRQYLNYARPDVAASCWTDATGVAVLALDTVPILTRKLLPAATTGSVRLWALCAASDASTDGEVVFTNNATAAAQTITFTNPGTTFAWASADATDYPCELLTEDDGLRPADTFATCTITYRRTGGAGTFYLAALGAYEIP